MPTGLPNSRQPTTTIELDRLRNVRWHLGELEHLAQLAQSDDITFFSFMAEVVYLGCKWEDPDLTMEYVKNEMIHTDNLPEVVELYQMVMNRITGGGGSASNGAPLLGSNSGPSPDITSDLPAMNSGS